MARTGNLTDFLTDVAAAIKTKKGSQTNIPAANFDTEILNIPSQGIYQEKSLTINQNGNMTLLPDTGYDGFDKLTLTVAVPSSGDVTYAELFAIADDIYNPGIPDDSATANFTVNDEQICLQKALKILRGGI